MRCYLVLNNWAETVFQQLIAWFDVARETKHFEKLAQWSRVLSTLFSEEEEMKLIVGQGKWHFSMPAVCYHIVKRDNNHQACVKVLQRA